MPDAAGPAAASAESAEYHALEQAAEWFAVLRSERAGAADFAAWQRWLDQDAMHRAAWQRVEQINHQFHALPGVAARQALAGAPARRRGIKALALLCAGGVLGGGLLAARHDTRGYLASLDAGYRTGIGETAALPLPDASQAWLNTDSAADVAYDEGMRRIVLRRGELLVHSAQGIEQPYRPLEVHTPAGRVRALGTRFSVRLVEHGVRVAVYDGAVQIDTAARHRQLLQAGGWLEFGPDWFGQTGVAREDGTAWSRQLLIASQMRLGDFVQELGRYRRGGLSCDPAVSELRLVGSYPLADTDQALAMLEATLPVRVRRTLPWWVSIVPR